MAKKDLTRLALERNLPILTAVKALLKEQVPYGPMRVQMTPSELKREIEKVRGGGIAALINSLGAEQVQKIMRDDNAKVR